MSILIFSRENQQLLEGDTEEIKKNRQSFSQMSPIIWMYFNYFNYVIRW